HITDEVRTGWGPYKLLNTVAMVHAVRGGCLPVLILRYSWHPGEQTFPGLMATTDLSRFHGGSIEDEIASLIGLSLGIRMRASSRTRLAWPDGLERPMAEDPLSVPTVPPRGNRAVMIELPRQVRVTADILTSYPNLPPKSAVALARAAR